METVAITGGTGSLGTKLTRHLLSTGYKVRVIARNEHNHLTLMEKVRDLPHHNLSSLIGDVRDKDRMMRAFRGVDSVIHAAAVKVIPLAAYNPADAIKTNVIGTMNVVDACLDSGVKRAVFISSDKACEPSTAYGSQKLAAEHLWLASNKYCGDKPGIFRAVRYGNVWSSNGSILHTFRHQAQVGEVTLTDPRCTRFHLTLDHAVGLVMTSLTATEAGDLLVPKLPSYTVTDIASVIAPKASIKVIGLRATEKLHESMISENESPYAYERESHYILKFGRQGDNPRFNYNSGSNTWRLTKTQIQEAYTKWLTERS